jgi:hypothetical protein
VGGAWTGYPEAPREMFESRRVSAAIAAAGFSVLAAAQVSPPQLPRLPDAGSILEQQRPKEPLPIRPSEEPVLPQVTPAPKPALPATTKVNVAVKDFRFSGNSVFPGIHRQHLAQLPARRARAAECAHVGVGGRAAELRYGQRHAADRHGLLGRRGHRADHGALGAARRRDHQRAGVRARAKAGLECK